MEQSATIGSNARHLLQGGPKGTRLSPFELITLLAIFLVGGFIGYTVYARLTDLNKQAPAAATYIPAFRTTLVSSVSTTGSVSATQQVALNFDMGQGTAKIQKFFVGLGDEVTVGQPLAKVDDSDLTKALTSAQSNLSASQARLNAALHPSTFDIASAQQGVASAQSQVTSAQNGLDKLKNPQPADVASAQQSISQAQNQIQTAQNAITTAQNNLNQAQQDAQTAELSAQTSVSSLESAWNSAAVSCSSSGMVPLSPISGSIATTVVIPISIISASSSSSSGSASATPTASSSSNSSSSSGCQSALSSYNSAASSYNTSLSNVQTKSNSVKTANQALNNGSLQSAVSSAQLQLQTANQKYLALINPTAADLTAAQGTLDSAKASLTSAQAKLDLLFNPTQDTVLPLQASVDQAQSSVSTTQKNLDEATITAPFDGTISQVNGDVGTLVTSSSTVFILLNPNLVRVDANVDQADINSLKQGQTATVTFDALAGNSYTGTVSAIGLTPTVSSGVVTYNVTFSIDTSRLRTGTPVPSPGMTASISVVTSRTDNALVVPSRTVKRLGGISTVTVKKADGSQQPRQINTGTTNGTLTQVTNGLQDGDDVLVSSGSTAAAPQISGTPSAGFGNGPPAGGPPPGFGP